MTWGQGILQGGNCGRNDCGVPAAESPAADRQTQKADPKGSGFLTDQKECAIFDFVGSFPHPLAPSHKGRGDVFASPAAHIRGVAQCC